MARPIYQIRVFARACLTRYDSGERELIDIVNSYRLETEDRDLVLAEIYAMRPELAV